MYLIDYDRLVNPFLIGLPRAEIAMISTSKTRKFEDSEEPESSARPNREPPLGRLIEGLE